MRRVVILAKDDAPTFQPFLLFKKVNARLGHLIPETPTLNFERDA
jgi:hypothetical protein